MERESKVNNFLLIRKTLNKTNSSLKLSPTNYQRLVLLIYWNFFMYFLGQNKSLQWKLGSTRYYSDL